MSVARILAPQRLWAVILVIFITPLCGWLYNCGCAYLWRGGASHCNIFDASQPDCPWCVIPGHCALCSKYATLFQFIPGIAIYLSIWGTIKLVQHYRGKNYLRDMLVGFISFLVSAFLIAWIYAKLTHYTHSFF